MMQQVLGTSRVKLSAEPILLDQDGHSNNRCTLWDETYAALRIKDPKVNGMLGRPNDRRSRVHSPT